MLQAQQSLNRPRTKTQTKQRACGCATAAPPCTASQHLCAGSPLAHRRGPKPLLGHDGRGRPSTALRDLVRAPSGRSIGRPCPSPPATGHPSTRRTARARRREPPALRAVAAPVRIVRARGEPALRARSVATPDGRVRRPLARRRQCVRVRLGLGPAFLDRVEVVQKVVPAHFVSAPRGAGSV